VNPLRTLILVAIASAPAHAGEAQFEGFYRARGRAFSSLSVAPDQPGAEGPTGWVQHRFWLQHRFVVNDKVAVYSEIRALDGTAWGQAPAGEPNPLFWNGVPGAQEPTRALPSAFSDDLRAPGVAAFDGLPRAVPDISIWRVWAEVHGETGTWRFGRMPIHWGLGIWQNDGLGLNADYGDSADRVQWERAFGDVFLRASGEIDTFGLADPDVRDTVSGNASVGWRGERVEIGLNTQARRALPRTGPGAIGSFSLGTASAALQAEVGSLRIGAELVARVGQGALDEANSDVTVQAFGGVVTAELSLDKLVVGVEGGFATGDRDPTDSKITTFAFDRDYNVALLMFEQPMPLLRVNGTRDFASQLSGNGVSNAFFARAHGSYSLPRGFAIDGAVVAARAFRVAEGLGDRSTYGLEVNLGGRYLATEKLDLLATGAVFVPGNYYRGAEPTGRTQPVIGGGQILSRVRF
jgi:hypothetical protein